MEEKFIEQIKKYVEMGIPCFPVRGKKSLVAWKQFQERLPTAGEMSSWNSIEGVTGIAGAMGKVCGGMIIDCDIKDPDNTCDPEIIKRLKAEGYPETLTGSKGSQFLVQWDSTLEYTSNAGVLKGLDIKAQKGYVLLPPSEALYGQDELEYAHFNGNKYEWIKEWRGEELKPFPVWLLDLIKSKKPKEKLNYSEAIKGTTIGNRNDLAVRLIGKYLYDCKTDEDFAVAWEAIKAWNTQCQPPLPEEELKNKFDFYANKKLEGQKNNKGVGDVFTRIGQAKLFIEKQPVYFSPEGLLWFWNFDRFCYELKDETDLLNGIRKEMNLDTVGSGNRTQILNALKQVGREQAPQEKPKGWIQFNDVLINPKTLEKTKADYKYFLTNPIPHSLGESEETPEVERLFREWVVKGGVQNETYIQSLYEYVAYSLTDDLFMQRIIALTGGGSNGKGTFLKLVEKLNGRSNCVSVDIKKLSTNNFAMSSIYKKLVAFAGEVSYSDLSNTNVLKKITGEDLIEYEFKGKNSFTDNSITTFFIATNSLPTTPDKSVGFYRRWAITDFPNIFSIKADVLSGIFEQEYENLCLKCVNILKNLYETHKFTNEGNYEEREQKYEERSNPLPMFIEENCEEVPGENIKLQEFGNKFNLWLKDKRLRLMTVRQIGQALRTLGYEIGKRKQEGDSFSAVLNIRFKFKTTETTKTTEV